MSNCKNIFSKLKSESFVKGRLRLEKFIQIDPQNSRSRDVWSLLIKTSVNEDIVLDHETYVSKAIHIW